MKVIVSESLGAGYTANIISSCNDAGVQAIADYNGNEILFYDPVNKLFARHSDIIKNMDIEIFDMFRDRKQKEDDGKVGLELRKEVMKPTEGKDFEDFATEWDALQKQESPDILKTKNCSVIRFGAHESGKPRIAGNRKPRKEFMDKVERFRKGWKSLDDKGDYVDDFGDRVNGVEAEVSEGLDDPRDWSASEGEVEIMWTVDYPEFGIESGNTESFVVEYDDVVDNEFDIEDNGLRDEICRLIGKEYPDLDFEPYDFDILNEREFWGDEASRHIYPYDESGIETDVVEGIPAWATSYILDGDDTGLNEDDKAEVDAYL